MGGGNQDFDTILNNYVGGGGRWQWQSLIYLFPVHIACGLPLLLHMFTAYTPSHRCFVEGCDVSENPAFDQAFLMFTTPKDHASSTFLKDAEDFDPCQMFARKANFDPGSCLPEAFDNSAKVNCSRFVYDTSEFQDTLSIEMDLVCDKVNQRHSLGSIMMLGLMTGSLLGGPLSDKIGRKATILGAVMICVPCLIGGGYVTSFASYAILRYITCTVIVFGWIGSHSLKIEFFSREKRTFPMAFDTLVSHSFNVGLPLLAYFARDWTKIHIWAGIISALALPTTYFLVPESMRWLMSNNRGTKAETILREIAQKNQKQVTDDDWQKIRAILSSIAAQKKAEMASEKLNLWDMFRRNLAHVTLILIFNWVAAIVTNYALTLNMNDMAGDIFVNFVLMAIIELPGIILAYYLMNKIGRRITLVSMMTGQSIFCLMLAFIPKTQSQTILLAFLVGKCFSTAASNVLWLYTAELYPTNLRSQSVGFCSMISRFFGMSSSFVGELAVFWTPLPMVLLGAPAFFAAMAALKLPDTKGKPLPETMDEALELNKCTHYASDTESLAPLILSELEEDSSS